MTKSNGKNDRKQLITLVRMLMYMIDESHEQGLERTAETLQSELDELQREHNITKSEIFPKNDN